ncbi:translation initiation factor IF-2-like [Pollicipes pollicipes]|uniref:translation initiation factor IF-2-like n=1 Tax=Pollicipes pollicipes TaxID=41117 RepID=UPI0018849B93|nr:translation initiation factor IF-2-like [Pollicipes pollicipes]
MEGLAASLHARYVRDEPASVKRPAGAPATPEPGPSAGKRSRHEERATTAAAAHHRPHDSDRSQSPSAAQKDINMDFERIFAVADEIKRRKSSDGASPRSAGVSPAHRSSPPRPVAAPAASGHDLTMALKFKRSSRADGRVSTPEPAGPGDDETHQYDHHFRKKFPHSQSRYWSGRSGAPAPAAAVTLPTMAPLTSFSSHLGGGEPGPRPLLAPRAGQPQHTARPAGAPGGRP